MSILRSLGMPQVPSTVRGQPGTNNAGMGQLPYQQQGAGPSGMMIQQMLPMLLQQMQQQQQSGMMGHAMSSMNTANRPMQAPVQAQPPNQNMFAGNSMQPAPQQQEQQQQPANRMFNPGSMRF